VRRAGPKKVRQYSLEFKLKAVKLSQLKGVEVQAVADALDRLVAVAQISEGNAAKGAGAVAANCPC
jgi:transposase-like protein